MRFSVRTLSVVLVTSLLAAPVLTGCTYTKRQLDYFTNDRKPQHVDGARRIPMLNPQAMAAEKPVMQAPAMQAPAPQQTSAETDFLPSFSDEETQPMQAEATRAPTYEESPYDYFDNKGNRVEPEAATQASATGDENFFTRLSGLFGSESSAVEELRDQPRKPLLGNDYPAGSPIAEPVSGIRPMVQAPAMLEPEVVTIADEPFYPVEDPAYSAMPAGGVSTLPEVEVSEKREKKNWFERVADDVESTLTDDKPEDKMMTEDKDVAYPALSAVPSAPRAFEEVKEDKRRSMQELEAERSVATQDRKALYSEPSGQDAMIPVEQATDGASAFKPSEALNEKELLLGHVSDESATAVAKKEEAASAKTIATEKAAKKGEWWEEWNIFSSKRHTEETMKEEQADKVALPAVDTLKEADPVKMEASQPAMPKTMATEQQPALAVPQGWQPVEPGTTPPPATMAKESTPLPAAMQPLLMEEAPASGEEAMVVPEPTQVKQDSTGGMPVDELVAEEEIEALPSTELLREIKTLPPSRYSGRRGAN